MATTATSANTEDAWGQPSTQSLNPARPPNSHSETVPDDWDVDDDEDEQDTRVVWETANARAPMPQIQLSTTSTPVGAQLPPAAAFEAPLRILKRPSAPNSKSPSPLDSAQAQKSFKEREAQYQAARERIFGDAETDKTTGTEARNVMPKLVGTQKSNILRDPIGPTSPTATGDAKRGFRSRKKKGSHPGTEQLDDREDANERRSQT